MNYYKKAFEVLSKVVLNPYGKDDLLQEKTVKVYEQIN